MICTLWALQWTGVGLFSLKGIILVTAATEHIDTSCCYSEGFSFATVAVTKQYETRGLKATRAQSSVTECTFNPT